MRQGPPAICPKTCAACVNGSARKKPPPETHQAEGEQNGRGISHLDAMRNAISTVAASDEERISQ